MKFRIKVSKVNTTSHIVDADSLPEALHKAVYERNKGQGESMGEELKTSVEKIFTKHSGL